MNYTFVCNEFDPERILFCGQAFRWKKEGEIYSGIASGHVLTLSVKENEVTFHDINEDEKDFWLNYFDIQTDYAALVNTFSADESMKKACGMCKGIRVLRQEPFEVLISFIISQNNNIKRITGIIERLCEYYGEPTEYGYMFPKKEALYDVAPDDLALLRAGFRAKYIAHAMELIKSGEIDLDSIGKKPSQAAAQPQQGGKPSDEAKPVETATAAAAVMRTRFSGGIAGGRNKTEK